MKRLAPYPPAPAPSTGGAPDGVYPCPFCAAPETEEVSLFGSQLLTSQYRCRRCGSYFEGLREDRWEERAAV
jgi:hypothetical protein